MVVVFINYCLLEDDLEALGTAILSMTGGVPRLVRMVLGYLERTKHLSKYLQPSIF